MSAILEQAEIPFRIAIVGCRDASTTFVREWLDTWLLDDFSEDVLSIVTGDANGADRAAREWWQCLQADREHWEGHHHRGSLTVHKADWDKHGKAAGPIRNSLIVADCDEVIAFWDGVSRGTLDTIRKATKAGKPVRIVGLP